MKRMHLVIDRPNDPWASDTYCGINASSDTIEWTMDRKMLLRHNAPCYICRKESEPEKPMPLGHARQELAKLEYYNKLGRQPKKVKTGTTENKLIQYLIKNGRTSSTVIAFEFSMKVSKANYLLEGLRRKGVVCKINKTWVAEEELPLPNFKLIDPNKYKHSTQFI